MPVEELIKRDDEFMGDWIRLLLAVFFFVLGIYFVADLFLSGFSWLLLIAAIGCFLLAHYIKPQNDHEDYSTAFDIIDLLIDIPFRTIALTVRGAGRLFKDGDGIDL